MEQSSNNNNLPATNQSFAKPKELSKRLLDGIAGTGGLRPLEVAKRYESTTGPGTNFPLLVSEGTQLSVLSRNLGTTAIEVNVGLLITDFVHSFNVSQGMNNDQIADLAAMLVSDYWFYTLEDFVVFFHRAKKSEFGKVFNRLDAAIIFEFLKVYDAERMESFFQYETEGRKLESKPLPPELQEGPFSFADVIRCLTEGIRPEDVIAEKTGRKVDPAPAAEDGLTVVSGTEDPEVARRRAAILELQVRAFCETYEPSFEFPGKFAEFFTENREAIEAEYLRTGKLKS